MAGKVNYGQVEKNIQERENKRNGGGKGSNDFVSLKYGDAKFMVCPPKDENSNWYHEIGVHFGFTDSQGNNRAYQCVMSKYGECPICDKAKELKSSGRIKEAQDIEAKTFFLFNILHVEDEKGEKHNFENKVLQAKASQKNTIEAAFYQYIKDEGADAADLYNRRVFRGTRLKADPWYTGRVLNNPADLTDEFIKEKLDNLADLTKAYVENTPEELTKMLNGEDINVKQEDGIVVSKKEATKVEKEIKAQDERISNIAKETPKTTTSTTKTTTPNKKLSTEELMAKLRE